MSKSESGEYFAAHLTDGCSGKECLADLMVHALELMCVRKRERARERERVSVCERERECVRERESLRLREREGVCACGE